MVIFFFFSFWDEVIGLVSAEYSSSQDIILAQFKSDAQSYCTKKNIAVPNFNDQNIIVLWQDAPDKEYDITLDMLLSGDIINLFVSSISDLSSNHIASLLQAYSMKHLNSIRIMDNDFFTFAAMPNGDNPSSLEAIKLETIRNLYEISRSNKSIIAEQSEFVHWYWLWQKGEISLNDICANHLKISKRSFYMRMQEYEHSCYYYEHSKLLYKQIKDCGKRGLLPDKDEFMNDVVKLDRANLLEKYRTNPIEFERILVSFTKGRRKVLEK